MTPEGRRRLRVLAVSPILLMLGVAILINHIWRLLRRYCAARL